MKKNNRARQKKWKRIIFNFLILFLFFSTVYFIFAIALYKIETQIRIVGCLALIDILFLLYTLLKKFRKKIMPRNFIIVSVIVFIYSITITITAHAMNNVYNKVSTISKTTTSLYSTSIITRKDSPADGVEDIKNSKIAVINDTDDYESYDLRNTIIEKEKLRKSSIVEYDNGIDLLNDLINGKIDFAIVPTNYEDRFTSDEEVNDISEKTKIIYTKKESKDTKISTKKKNKSLKEPFTVLIMGFDTVGDGIGTVGGGDALLLVTVNPQTANTTILSIPRDSYMPISCMNGRKNKITNAGWKGESCINDTLENYFGIDIDYHVKINFNGVVQLVEAVGGVEVDVPYPFCEQNSKRQWGKNTIKVDAGLQTLNGEEALAFARHRKNTSSKMLKYCEAKYIKTDNGYYNDFTRGQDQQIIIKALLKKFKNIDSFDKIEDILDTISKNIETDISMDNLFSLYDLGKNILKNSADADTAFNMQKLYLSGADARIYDYSFKHNNGTKLITYNYSIYEESKEAVITAMKQNLNLIAITPVKSFSYSIKEKYEEYVIGKNVGTTNSLVLLPNFVGSNVSVAEDFADKNNLTLNINYTTGSPGQKVGQIISQNIPAATDLDMLNASRSVEITVVDTVDQSQIDTDTDETDEQVEDDNVQTDEEDTETDDTETTQ